MGYAFDVDETVREAVHRITDEQVERAIAALEQASGDGQRPGFEAAVHDCRKRTKKLRALIRLARPALGQAFGPANESFRDAARELSGLRDANAALATFDALVAVSPGGEPGRPPLCREARPVRRPARGVLARVARERRRGVRRRPLTG